jgi:trimethylamine--corrinoid protein Co-methyltransferase
MLAALVQLGKSYGLPTQAISLVTDSVIPDAQAGVEKVQASYLALMAHPDLVGGMGCLSDYEGASMEQLVLDSDILSGLFHALEGLRVDEDSLAWGVIDQVGPGGNYLGERHTLRHLRREYYFSNTANRLAPEAWAAAGAQDVRARASEQVRKLLAEPAEPIVSQEVIRELRRVMECAREDLAR